MYKDVFSDAIREVINIKLAELSQKFHRIASQGHATKPDAQRIFRRNYIPLYVNCKLEKGYLFRVKILQNIRNQYQNPYFAKKKFSEEDSASKSNEDNRVFLVIEQTSKEEYTRYNKDDLWIISSENSFCPKSPDDLFFFAKRYEFFLDSLF